LGRSGLFGIEEVSIPTGIEINRGWNPRRK